MRYLVPALILGVALAGIVSSETQAQALLHAAPRLQPVRYAPLEELPRPYAGQRLPLSSIGLPTILKFPELIGGIRNLQEQVRYPEAAFANGIQGVVKITFVVNEQGYVEQAVVVESVGGGCDEEALRVVRSSRFKPGVRTEITMDGNWIRQVVPVEMEIPITFKLYTNVQMF